LLVKGAFIISPNLDIPLQFWIMQNTKDYPFMDENYLTVTSDPKRALQVATIRDRIEALDQAIQRKKLAGVANAESKE